MADKKTSFTFHDDTVFKSLKNNAIAFKAQKGAK